MLNENHQLLITSLFRKKRESFGGTFKESNGKVTLGVLSVECHVTGKKVDNALYSMHHILTIIDMDVSEFLHPTLRSMDHLVGKVIYALSRQGVDDAGEDAHLLLQTGYVERMACSQ